MIAGSRAEDLPWSIGTADDGLARRTSPAALHRRSARVILARLPLALAALLSTAALADTRPPSPVPSLAEKAARRFPQPVRVGDLIGRQVLEPVPAQHVLGRVAALRRSEAGAIEVVIRTGGFLGFGTRPVAVPVEAVALLGEHVALLDLTPEQLRTLPIATETGSRPIVPDERIRVGLTKPFH